MLDQLTTLAGLAANALAILAACYVGCYALLQTVMLGVAWVEIRRQRTRYRPWLPEQVLESSELPAITVVIPAYNEAVSIVRTVESVLESIYPEFEIIVVNDGSTDATLAALERAFDLEPLVERGTALLPSQPVRQTFRSRRIERLRVVDKRNGGKADALNAGIGRARHALVCVIDADLLLDRWALFHLARPFVDNPPTVASSGIIRLLPAKEQPGRRLPKPWVERFQVLEYLRAFSVGRLAFNPLNGHLIISGALGLFRRDVLLEIGGYQTFSIGEDMELVVRLHHHLRSLDRPYRIEFVADAFCSTEPPHTVGELGRQRTRWHQGLLTTLRLHRGMAFRSRFGAIGWLALPYFWLFELLAPIVELTGWVFLPIAWAAGVLDVGPFAFFLAASLLWGTAISLVSLAIDVGELRFFTHPADVAWLCVAAGAENLGYRQLALYFRLRAFARYYRSVHLHSGWRSPARAGLASTGGGAKRETT